MTRLYCLPDTINQMDLLTKFLSSTEIGYQIFKTRYHCYQMELLTRSFESDIVLFSVIQFLPILNKSNEYSLKLCYMMIIKLFYALLCLLLPSYSGK